MAQLTQVLAEFGEDIGLPALAPGPGGSLQLRLASGALLGVSTQGDEVVLHHAEPVPYDLAALVLKAMQRAARSECAADPVQVGVRTTAQGQWLVVGTRLPLERFSAREMHRLAGHLQAWIAQARGMA
ncbi:hypothetical protein [Pantoea sp. 18069]|uniref:hypothetical protein n=1 Tax=Pantoea sp. 18069 TaxID=2681415 RepID=UPI00135A28FA|nr:hypothetical protein [Pantoea sp. 18069]